MILAHFPHLTTCTFGSEHILAYNKAIGEAMSQTCKNYYDEDSLVLLHVAKEEPA